VVGQSARQAPEVVRGCHVLETGQVMFAGIPKELRQHPALTKAYLGVTRG
jgi:ABC-type branched-subunit amino acid transport system ATPase component